MSISRPVCFAEMGHWRNWGDSWPVEVSLEPSMGPCPLTTYPFPRAPPPVLPYLGSCSRGREGLLQFSCAQQSLLLFSFTSQHLLVQWGAAAWNQNSVVTAVLFESKWKDSPYCYYCPSGNCWEGDNKAVRRGRWLSPSINNLWSLLNMAV